MGEEKWRQLGCSCLHVHTIGRLRRGDVRDSGVDGCRHERSLGIRRIPHRPESGAAQSCQDRTARLHHERHRGEYLAMYHLYVKPSGFADISDYPLNLEFFPDYAYLGEFSAKPDVDGRKYVNGAWVWGGTEPEFVRKR